jgi:outer membrane usher protein
MVLAVSLNTVKKGDLFVNRTADGDFLVKTADLIEMGFTAPTGTTTVIDGEPHISLRSIQGLAFRFDEKALALAITADPHLLPTNTLDLSSRHRLAPASAAGPSAFFNYAFSHSGQGGLASPETDFAGELGIRAGEYLFLGNANTVRTAAGDKKLVRFMTSLTRDDVNSLQRFVAGDFFASSRDLGNGALLGGLGISKLYDLNPYLLRSPTQNITGVAALPSDLEVYVDGQRVRTERLQPGTFELKDLLGYGGSRSVQVLLRDPFGRVQQIDYPFYFSDQPLRQGLHEYSYGLGALRRNFGTASNDYGPLAFSMFHRYGVSDSLTAGFRAEGKKGLYNAGPIATVMLGTAGVLNLALAASSLGGERGLAGMVGYSYQSRAWSLGASLRKDSRHYANLGDPVTLSSRKLDASVSVGYNFEGKGTVSLSHSVLTTHSGQAASPASATQPFAIEPLQDRRETTLSYSLPLLSGRASLVANLTHARDVESRNELFVNLNFYLDKGQTVATTFQQLKDTSIESFQFSRPQPIGEGIGYDVATDRSSGPDGESLQLRASTQLNAPAAVLRAEYGQVRQRGQSPSSTNTYRFALSGGLAYVGNTVSFGRPVTDSFGIVKVGHLPGVPVTVNGLDAGKTDAQGQLFIPALSSYHDNQVAIASENIPMDYSFDTTLKRVVPAERSGVVLDFEVTKIHAASGNLQFEQDGVLKPLELQQITLQVKGHPMTLPTGRGGEFYVENLAAGSYPATSSVEGQSCRFDLVIPQSEEPLSDLGKVVCRLAH